MAKYKIIAVPSPLTVPLGRAKGNHPVQAIEESRSGPVLTLEEEGPSGEMRGGGDRDGEERKELRGQERRFGEMGYLLAICSPLESHWSIISSTRMCCHGSSLNGSEVHSNDGPMRRRSAARIQAVQHDISPVPSSQPLSCSSRNLCRPPTSAPSISGCVSLGEVSDVNVNFYRIEGLVQCLFFCRHLYDETKLG